MYTSKLSSDPRPHSAGVYSSHHFWSPEEPSFNYCRTGLLWALLETTKFNSNICIIWLLLQIESDVPTWPWSIYRNYSYIVMWKVHSTDLKLPIHLGSDLQVTKSPCKSRQTFPRGRVQGVHEPSWKLTWNIQNSYYPKGLWPFDRYYLHGSLTLSKVIKLTNTSLSTRRQNKTWLPVYPSFQDEALL